MTPGDELLWLRTTQLKERNQALKVFLSIGGWSFNDPVNIFIKYKNKIISYVLANVNRLQPTCGKFRPHPNVYQQRIKHPTSICL